MYMYVNCCTNRKSNYNRLTAIIYDIECQHIHYFHLIHQSQVQQWSHIFRVMQFTSLYLLKCHEPRFSSFDCDTVFSHHIFYNKSFPYKLSLMIILNWFVKMRVPIQS